MVHGILKTYKNGRKVGGIVRKEVKKNKIDRNTLEMFIKTIIRYLYPVVFLLSIFANTVSYYLTLGNRNEIIRKIISWGIIFLVCGISVGYLLICIKEKRKYVSVFGIPAIMFVGLCITLVKEPANMEIIKQILLMMLYGIPALTFAVYAIEEKMGRRLFQNFWIVSIFLLPMYVLFILFVTGTLNLSEEWSNLGEMSYLAISYSALFLFSGMVLHYIFGEEFLMLKRKMVYMVLNFIQVIVITKGGSRGALLILLLFVVLTLIVVLVKKWRRKQACILLGSICVVACISVCFGKGDLSKVRWNSLLADFTNGKVVSAIQNREENVGSEPEREESEVGKSEGTESIPQAGLENTDDKNKYVEEFKKSGNMARIYLYKYAIHDIMEHPFTGMGAYGYQLKYGTYPHNFLLHLFVDFGIPMTVLILLWLLRCLYCFVKKGDEVDGIAVILFSCSLGATIMLSGGIYDSGVFIWLISYFQAAVSESRIRKIS